MFFYLQINVFNIYDFAVSFSHNAQSNSLTDAIMMPIADHRPTICIRIDYFVVCGWKAFYSW